MSAISKFARREALLLMAGAMLPSVALAQDAVPWRAPNVDPAVPKLDFSALTGGVPAQALGPIDKNKTYFLFFQRMIDVVSAKTLRNNLVQLVEGGVTNITLVISSPGGLVMQAMQLYSLIRSLPADIRTHGQGFVQSAANILMLAGNKRSADPETRFWFHPAQTPIFGTFNSPQFEDQMQMLRDAEDTLVQIYKERTRIPVEEINRFRHETVDYDAAKALEYGIVQRVRALDIPAHPKAKLVFVD